MMPDAYHYIDHLMRYIGDLGRIFTERPIWPRQISFYLPGNNKQACNFHCNYCAGKLGQGKLSSWEPEGLKLINNLGHSIPYHLYSGYYTEPTLSRFLLKFISSTKKNGCRYGLKTNGSLLTKLEESEGFITKLIEISNSPEDFISISLDAGYPESHAKTKKVSERIFADVCDGVRQLVKSRGRKECPAIRLSFLLNKVNDSPEEINEAILFARDAGVDSLRFSQAHPVYGLENSDIQWDAIMGRNEKYRDRFKTLISRDKNEYPFIFFAESSRRANFRKCAYGYYQICVSHDGYIYRCTSVADSKYDMMRLGPISSDLSSLKEYIYRNQDPAFDPQECFKQGAYCCRAACAVNKEWADYEGAIHNR